MGVKPRRHGPRPDVGFQMRVRRAAVLGAVLMFLGGCGDNPAATSLAPAASQLPLSSVSQEELASWIRFRLVYSLRADIDWVLGVAQDPNATLNEYRVPLLPDELERVTEANASADSLLPVARAYADDFPTFAGAWLELPRVVLAFTDGLPERQADVEAIFADMVVVRQARYTLLELEGFEDIVEAEREWLTALGVSVIDIGLDEMLNVVSLDYRAQSQAVEAQILERLGKPDWLRLEWAGPLPWTGPYGQLEIAVVDQDGQPVPASINLRPLDPRVTGFGPVDLDDGTFTNPAWPAVSWQIDVTYTVDGVERTITKEFTVPEDDLVRVRVVVSVD